MKKHRHIYFCRALRCESTAEKTCRRKIHALAKPTLAAQDSQLHHTLVKKEGDRALEAATNGGEHMDKNMEEFYFKRSKLSKDPYLDIVLIFFSEYGEATQNAILLLGGSMAHRRCLRLFTALQESETLNQRHREELVRLHSVLMLDAIDESGAKGADLFIDIHPSNPIVEELCLLADQLFHLLKMIGERPTDCEPQAILAAMDNAA
jgi:hypothetical protein